MRPQTNESTDRRTDGRTDKASQTVASPELKTNLHFSISPLRNSANDAQLVAFESEEEWKEMFEMLKKFLQSSGKKKLFFFINARLQNGKYVWQTNEKELPLNYLPKYAKHAHPSDLEKECVYAFITSDIKYNRAWGTTKCDQTTKDLVCQRN